MIRLIVRRILGLPTAYPTALDCALCRHAHVTDPCPLSPR